MRSIHRQAQGDAAGGVRTFASVADRAKASSDQFMQVAKQYSSTPDGKNARYFASLTYIEAGQSWRDIK